MLACPPFWKWFVGGKLNACYNCVDRHQPKYGNKAALIFAPEPKDEGYQAITYEELTPSVFGGTPAVFGGGNQRLHSASVRWLSYDRRQFISTA
jgi:acetyl-CoA synthetase-like protein